MRPARSALGSGCAKGAKSTRDTVPSAAIQSLSSSEGAGRSFAERIAWREARRRNARSSALPSQPVTEAGGYMRCLSANASECRDGRRWLRNASFSRSDYGQFSIRAEDSPAATQLRSQL